MSIHDSAIDQIRARIRARIRRRARARFAAVIVLLALAGGAMFGGTITTLMRPVVAAVEQLPGATHANPEQGSLSR